VLLSVASSGGLSGTSTQNSATPSRFSFALPLAAPVDSTGGASWIMTKNAVPDVALGEIEKSPAPMLSQNLRENRGVRMPTIGSRRTLPELAQGRGVYRTKTSLRRPAAAIV